MPEVLVVTGPCGIGKTTLTNAWADARAATGGGAAIHADDIHLWIRVKSIRRGRGYQEDLKAKVALTTAHELLAQGLSIAIDNVWRPETLERFRAEFSPLSAFRAVRLECDLAINENRDQGREVGRMGPRVAELTHELNAMIWPQWLPVLDTTGQSVAESLAAIEALPVIV